MARDVSSDSQEGGDDVGDVNLLAMQMQRYQFESVPTLGELWTIWSLVDSTCYDINGRDNLGIPPIVYAAKRGSLILLRLLLNYHADVNAMSWMRETAVVAACRKQKHGAVRLLIKRGARLDLIDRSQFSALRWASTNSDVPLIRLLLQHKVSVTSDCYTANSALEIAMAQPTKTHAKIALLLQRQLVVERRQLLQDVIKQKERDEIAEIKKHRRKMRRQVRKEKEEQEAASSERPPPPPPKSVERSPFSLPIIPSLKKKTRAPDQEVGHSYSRPQTASLKPLLQNQLLAPPAMVWAKAGRGQWRQVEAQKGSHLTQVLPVQIRAFEDPVHQLVNSESKWTAFMHEPHSTIVSNQAKPGDAVDDSNKWQVEDME